jgi:23S rRNA C2498 (ribose-2'-O)-methylase RlmM
VDECPFATPLGEGYVHMHKPLPRRPLVFERQRMADVRSLSPGEAKPLTQKTAKLILQRILLEDTLWTTHTFHSDPAMASRAQGFEAALLRMCKKLDMGTFKCWRKPEKLVERNTGLALQLFFAEDQVWFSTASIDVMFDPWPAGIRRMKMDEESPSRSFLKLEEAFSYLGREPRAGETVVDLGAAPGGWSQACLRRGAHVLAIDNGPMKINHPHLTHLRHDGLSYRPEGPVDWLVSDMLVPPGLVIGLLRNWIGKGWARYFVFNVKIPQEEAYQALVPLQSFLASAGVDIRLKQLYHDRREVTGFGAL